jgi:hypothetical protein
VISRRLEELKKSSSRMSIFAVCDDYKMKMQCAKLCCWLPPREKTIIGEDMAQYLVAIYLPDDFDPSRWTKRWNAISTRSTRSWTLRV